MGWAAGLRSRFERLSQVHRCLQSGSRPGVSAATLASLLMEGAGEVSREGGGPAGSLELTGLSMSLLRKITSSLTARSLPPALASYLVETVKILVHEMDLMSHLVSPPPQMLSEAILMFTESLCSLPGASFPGFGPDLVPSGCQDRLSTCHLSSARIRESSSVAFTEENFWS